MHALIVPFLGVQNAQLSGSDCETGQCRQRYKYKYTSMRDEAGLEYANIFKETEEMAEVAGTQMAIPRRCGKQINRWNKVPHESPEVYWRRVVFLLDELMEQLALRFPALTAQALIGLKLLPVSVQNLTAEDAAKLEECYGEDLPSPLSLSAEIRMWMRKWECSESKPQTLQATLAMTLWLIFANIHRILYLLVIPVTSAGVERANSAMKWGSPSASDPRAKNTGQRATKGTVLTSQSLSPWCDCRRLGSTWASWRWQDINVGNPL